LAAVKGAVGTGLVFFSRHRNEEMGISVLSWGGFSLPAALFSVFLRSIPATQVDFKEYQQVHK
jgi:hypothetical protein